MELRHYASTLLKWWWLIVASVVIATVSSYFGTRAIAPTYQASTTLMVGQALQNPNPNAAEFYTGQVLAQSYTDLVRRQPVLEGTLKTLGLTWDWRVLQGMVSSRVVAGTQLLEISVLDTDPQRAPVLADEIARQLILQSPAGSDPEMAARGVWKSWVTEESNVDLSFSDSISTMVPLAYTVPSLRVTSSASVRENRRVSR